MANSLAYARAYRERYPERARLSSLTSAKKAYGANPDKYRERARAYYRILRLEMVAAYGGQCACCSEDHEVFLTLEHTNGDGAEHRRQITKHRSHKTNAAPSAAVYRDLKKRGWPKEGFALLCANCQVSHYKLGAAECPYGL